MRLQFSTTQTADVTTRLSRSLSDAPGVGLRLGPCGTGDSSECCRCGDADGGDSCTNHVVISQFSRPDGHGNAHPAKGGPTCVSSVAVTVGRSPASWCRQASACWSAVGSVVWGPAPASASSGTSELAPRPRLMVTKGRRGSLERTPAGRGEPRLLFRLRRLVGTLGRGSPEH